MKAQRLKIDPASVHTKALSKFLNQYCQGYGWYDQMMGSIRSRNYSHLIKLAKDIDANLLLEIALTEAGDTPSSCKGDPLKHFATVSQLVAMITKYPYSPKERPGIDPDKVALENLLKDERRNRKLNRIFRMHMARGNESVRHPAHLIMRKSIQRVLGESPPIDEILAHCNFSAGANVGISGKATHVGVKLTGPITITPSCVGYFIHSMRHNHQAQQVMSSRFERRMRRFRAHPNVGMTSGEVAEKLGLVTVQTNEICCVPKNSDTSRVIAKEPLGNIWVQSGVEYWMKQQLIRKLNLDLREQGINQVMALEGSYADSHDPYVTIDVKSASNSILTQLVKYLLPREWFSFLDAIRSPAGVLPGEERKIHRWELFSSMGNVFTFPLETLIFSSCVIAACRMCNAPIDFRVYGDDIICRQSVALLVIEILRSCGFRINVEKTHVHGPFRESCGANWYEGADVTPVYWRGRINSRSALHAIHNAHHPHGPVQETLRTFDRDMPCVVPDDAQYGWVTDQAFRVPQDVWMTHRGVVWRRDTQSFRYPMLLTSPVKDVNFGPAVSGQVYKHARQFALFRGATFGNEFLLRRSTHVKLDRARTDSRLECDYSKGRSIATVAWNWHADSIHAYKLLTYGGMPQHRARKIVSDWARAG